MIATITGSVLAACVIATRDILARRVLKRLASVHMEIVSLMVRACVMRVGRERTARYTLVSTTAMQVKVTDSAVMAHASARRRGLAITARQPHAQTCVPIMACATETQTCAGAMLALPEMTVLSKLVL
jgi:hypothetical protein